MKLHILLPTTIVLAILLGSTSSCQINCCNKSTDCCNTSINCQTTTNCCQQSSNCCKSCQSKCGTSTCVDQCKQKCTVDDCKPSDTTENVTNDKTKEIIINRDTGSNTNDNKFNFTASINMNNTVNNENRVYIPINVTNSNFNNVIITSSAHQSPEESKSTDIPLPTQQPPITQPLTSTTLTTSAPTSSFTTPSTVTPCPESSLVPVPIPVPNRPVFNPVPQTVPQFIPQPLPGCCIIVNPCSSYRCRPYQMMCSFECTSSFMYRPVNPCEGQCNRRQYSLNRYCYQGGYCQNNLINCSGCSEEFYQSYGSYQQCGGCFYR